MANVSDALRSNFQQPDQHRRQNTMGNIVQLIKDCFKSIPDNDKRAKILPSVFLASLLFSISGADYSNFSLANLRLAVIASAEETISRSTFWERISTKKLQSVLMFLLSILMARIATKIGIGKKLLEILNVSGVYLLDSTSITLPKGTKGFPAPRNNVVPAAIKWHNLYDVISGAIPWFDLTAATVNDRKGFPPLEVLKKGTLIIFDLGYWDYDLLKDLILNKIYFLSRVKKNAKIKIEEVIIGIPKRYCGRILMNARFPGNSHKIVEIIGSFHRNNSEVFKGRVIGFWNPTEKVYHWYVTNLLVSKEIIYTLYRLRWQIELIFKTFKSAFNFSKISSTNKNIIINLILVAITNCLISLALGTSMAVNLDSQKQAARSIQKCAMVFTHFSKNIFEYILGKISLNELLKKIRRFIDEIFDPNYRSRKTTLAMLCAVT